MSLAEIIISEIERNGSSKVFKLFAKRIGQSGEPAAVYTKSMILLLNVRGRKPAYVRHSGNDRGGRTVIALAISGVKA
jgi:hypothetical protein